MDKLIANFTKQLEEAVKIGRDWRIAPPEPGRSDISEVLICGMGGSGIGGSIVSLLTEAEAKVPVTVCKNYSLPGYTGKNTLAVLSSYSGNTEETLAAMNLACAKEARIVCITSGGEMLKYAREQNLDHIVIPGGMPPRACLAYSFTQLLYILGRYGIITMRFEEHLLLSIRMLNAEEPGIKKEARKIAETLSGKIPVIYCAAPFEGVAVRFRQQLNENAKMLCWHHVFPELCHNELVGWKRKNNKLAVVIMKNDTDHERIRKRMELCREVFSKRASTVVEICPHGSSGIEKTLYFIHLFDWVSFFLSGMNGVDAIQIKAIDRLKNELKKQ